MANEEQIEQLGVNLSVTGSEKFGPDLDSAALAMKGFTAETNKLEKASPKFDAASKIIAGALKSINVASKGLDKSTASMDSFSAAMGKMSANATKMASSVNAAATAQSRSAAAAVRSAIPKPDADNDAHVKSWEEFQKSMQGRRSRLGPTYGSRVDAGSAQVIRDIKRRIEAEKDAAQKIKNYEKDQNLATTRMIQIQKHSADAQIAIEKVLQDTQGKSAAYRKMKLQEVKEATEAVTKANIESMKYNLAFRKSIDANSKAEATSAKSQQERVAAVTDRLRKKAEMEAAKAKNTASNAGLGLIASKDVQARIETTLKAQLATIDQMARQTQANFSEQSLRDFRTFKTRIDAQTRGTNQSIQSRDYLSSQTDVLKDVGKGKQRLKVINMSAEDRALAGFEQRLRSSNMIVRTIAQTTLRWREGSLGILTVFDSIAGAIKGIYKAIVFILSPIRIAVSLLSGLFRMLQKNTDETEKSTRAAEKLASANRKSSSSVQRPAMARGQLEDGAAQKKSFFSFRPQTVKIQADTAQAEQSISRVKSSVKEATRNNPKIRIQTDAGDTATTIDRVNVSTRKARNEMGQFAAQANKTASALSTVAPQANEAAQQIIQIGVTARQTESALTKLFFVISGSFATGLGIGLAQSLFHAGGNAILSTIENIKNSVAGLVSEGFSAISDRENILVSLSSLLSSEMVMAGQFKNVTEAEAEANKGAQELYEWVTKLAIISPFEKQDILNVMQMGMGFGISADNMKVLTQATVDWGARGNKSGSEMESVARAIGQISSSSVVAKEDLNQLRDAGLPAAQILAKMRGQTDGQFLQDVTDGAIKGTEAITLLTEYMQTQFEGAASKAGGTLSGLVSSLRDIKSERLGQLFQPITDTLVKPILEMVVALAQAEGAGQFFADLGLRIQALGSLLTGVIYNGFALLRQFLAAIPPDGVAFIETFVKIGAILLGVKIALATVGVGLALFGAAIGLVLSPIALLVGGITALYLAYQNSLFGIREISVMAQNAIGGFVKGSLGWIAELYNGGGAYMDAFGQSVSDAVSWVLSSIEQLPIGFVNVMDAVFVYGQNIINMFADGVRAAGRAVWDALNYIGSMFEYWLTPGSPPKLLPDLTTWGTGAADAYLEGWKKADFDMLKDLGGLIEGAMGSISNDSLPIEQITKIREAVAATIGSFNDTGKFDDSGIRAVSGPFAETLSNISRAYLETASSARTMASAQAQLEKSTEFYTNALKPLHDRLKQIQGLQSNSGLDTEAIELNRVLQNTSATSAQKDAAKLRLEELNIQKEINKLEGEQAAKSESLQTKINAATKQNTLSQENLDILKERFSVQQGIQEGIQANVRAAIAEANAIKQQVEKDVVGKSDAEAEKMRKEAEKNADAQLALNMQMADTPGKIALLRDKLAGLTEGSTEYLEVQKQIVALEQKSERETEAEAKRLEAEGRSAEAAAKRAEAQARKDAKLAPGGALALGGGAQLAMPQKLDFTSITAKFEESSLKIKESFSKITEGIVPITEGLTKAKEVVDGIVTSFKDGFGGKDNAMDGFTGMVNDLGGKALVMDLYLRAAATSLETFKTNFSAAFDMADGTVTEKFKTALDVTGVTTEVENFKSFVMSSLGDETGGKGEESTSSFGAKFVNAFSIAPGSLVEKFKAGMDEAGVTTTIDTFKTNIDTKMQGFATSPMGVELKSKVDIVLSQLTVTGVTEAINNLRWGIIDSLSSFTFTSVELENLRLNLIDALENMDITAEDVSAIGTRIVQGIALFFGLGPLLKIGSALITGIVGGLGGAGVTFSGIGSAIVTGIGAVIASPFLWIPLGAVIVGAIVKSIGDAFNANTSGMGVMEKGQAALDKMSSMASAASTWVSGMVSTVIDAISKVDWAGSAGASGFTIGAGVVKMVEAIAKILIDIPWGRLLKAAIEFVGGVISGLVVGLVTGLLWGIWDSIGNMSSEVLTKTIKTIFGAVVGAITGVLNVVSSIVNMFTSAINAALPEGYQIGQIPQLILDVDMNVTTQKAITEAQTELDKANLLVKATMDTKSTSGDILQQIQDSGIGDALAEKFSLYMNEAITGSDYGLMVQEMQKRLGRELTAADMVNLDPLLNELNFEFERVALAMSQSSNAGDIVKAVNTKLGTDFADTDFSGAGTALLNSLNNGMGAGGNFEFTSLNTLLDEAGVNVEAKAKEIGEKASSAIKTGMSSATAEKHSSRDDAPAMAGGFFNIILTDAETAAAKIPEAIKTGMDAGSATVVESANTMGKDIVAGVDTGSTEAVTSTDFGFWSLLKAKWNEEWGIHSPSTVASDEFGIPIGEGVLGGVSTALEGAVDPLETLRTSMETSLTTILASVTSFGTAAKAQFVVLKQALTTTAIEQATVMKNLYAALFKDLLAKSVAFRTAIIKDTQLMYDGVKRIFVTLSAEVKALMQALYEEIIRIMQAIRQDSVAELSGMKDDMVQLIEEMNAAIGEELDKLPDIFEEKLAKVVEVIESDTLKQKFIDAGTGLGVTFLESIADGLQDSTELARIDTAINEVVATIEEALVAALEALAEALANVVITPTPTPDPVNGPRSLATGSSTNLTADAANQVVNNSNNLANRIINRSGQTVQASTRLGQTQQVIAPVNNNKTYILQMQVTPSQVERVSANYALFEALTN